MKNGAIGLVLLFGILAAAIVSCGSGEKESSAGTDSGKPGKIVIIQSAEDYDRVVNETSNLLLVDFWANWCPPCRYMNPILKDVAKEHGSWVTIAKVDVDQHKALMQKFNVEAIPTLILYRAGQIVDRRVGAMSKEDLVAWLNQNRS